ncbi:hypothetical protein D3C80_2038830 [compost metagenome]
MGTLAQLSHNFSRILKRAVAEDHGEFLTAIAAENVAGAEGVLQQFAEGHQRTVADIMSVIVIQFFEIIDINQTKG